MLRSILLALKSDINHGWVRRRIWIRKERKNTTGKRIGTNCVRVETREIGKEEREKEKAKERYSKDKELVLE